MSRGRVTFLFFPYRRALIKCYSLRGSCKNKKRKQANQDASLGATGFRSREKERGAVEEARVGHGFVARQDRRGLSTSKSLKKVFQECTFALILFYLVQRLFVRLPSDQSMHPFCASSPQQKKMTLHIRSMAWPNSESCAPWMPTAL